MERCGRPFGHGRRGEAGWHCYKVGHEKGRLFSAACAARQGDDCLFASRNLAYLVGGEDSDQFSSAITSATTPFQGWDLAIVVDFSSANQDRLVFHTSDVGT